MLYYVTKIERVRYSAGYENEDRTYTDRDKKDKILLEGRVTT